MRKAQPVRDALSIVRASVLREGLIPPGSRVLVACSGGPDSTALLHILVELGREVPFSLAVAHFDHRLRASAGRDARFVRDAARALGLAVFVGRRDVRSFARSRGMNLEEAARELRYAFLARAAARAKADLVATGHTLNDQAETLLMRLLRGSGPRGLSGISPSIEGRVIRPLLGVARAEVLDFCRKRRLAFREDESNRDRRLLRNRIRLDLIPRLERLEPLAVRALGRSAEIIRGEDAIMETAARRAFSRLVRGRGKSAELDAPGLARLPAGLGRRVVRAYIDGLRGHLRRLTFDAVEAVRLLENGATRTLPGGLALRRDDDRIRVRRARSILRPPDFSLTWDGRAPLAVPAAGLILRAKRIGALPGRLDFDDLTRACCDAAMLRFPLEVSPRKPGDRYRPLGAPGRKSLKEILRARGIPADVRAALPLIRSAGGIVWAPGLPVGEDFRVKPGTRTVFVIEAARQRAR